MAKIVGSAQIQLSEAINWAAGGHLLRPAGGSCEAVGGVKEAQIKSLFRSKSSTRAPGSNKAPECSKYLKCQSKHSSNQKPREVHLNAQVKGDFRYEMSMKRVKYMHMNATHQIPQA